MKTALYFSVFLVLVLVIISGVATWNEIQDVRNSANDSTALNSGQTEYPSSELRSLLRERAFKESLLSLSQSDSIGLIIDLKDSSLSLAIKGIIIHQSKITHFKIDQLLIEIPQGLYLSKYSKPMKKVSERSTIIKEPIVVREAPKDPVEASINAYQPDTLIQNPAFFEFILDTNLKLIFEQDKNPTIIEKMTRLRFMIPNLDMDPLTVIKIKSSMENLRIIYRALPSSPQIVIYLP